MESGCCDLLPNEGAWQLLFSFAPNGSNYFFYFFYGCDRPSPLLHHKAKKIQSQLDKIGHALNTLATSFSSWITALADAH